MELKKKVIIDTDIGDDIDDAIALTYALGCEQLDILGITTVFLSAEKRAQIVKSILNVANRNDIPVYPGSSNGLVRVNHKEHTPCQWGEEMASLEIGPKNSAVDFMAKLIKENPHEITIIAIGPLTNIAILLREYEELIPLIKEIVWMGGAFYYHFVTWNAACDVEATATVLNTPNLPLRVISRDVCEQCIMPVEDVKTLFESKNEVLAHLTKLIKRWKLDFGSTLESPILFDSLTVNAAFSDEYVGYSKERVLVETSGAYTRGMTFVVNHPNYESFYHNDYFPPYDTIPKIKVANTVLKDAFVKHHTEVILNKFKV